MPMLRVALSVFLFFAAEAAAGAVCYYIGPTTTISLFSTTITLDPGISSVLSTTASSSRAAEEEDGRMSGRGENVWLRGVLQPSVDNCEPCPDPPNVTVGGSRTYSYASGVTIDGMTSWMARDTSGGLVVSPTQASVADVALLSITNADSSYRVDGCVVAAVAPVTNVFTTTSTAASTLLVSGSLTALGGSNVSVSDTLTVTAQSFLNVSGSLEASGRIVLFAPMRIIVGATFSIAQRPSLVVYVTEAPVVSLLGNGSGTFTVPIATHSHRDGVFSNVTVLLTYPNARQSSQPCYTVGSAEPDYGSSSMSVTVAVDPCKSGDSGASGGNRSGLSDGAIVGIAVGVTAAGVLIAVLIGVMVWRARRLRTAQMNKDIRMAEVARL